MGLGKCSHVLNRKLSCLQMQPPYAVHNPAMFVSLLYDKIGKMGKNAERDVSSVFWLAYLPSPPCRVWGVCVPTTVVCYVVGR